MAHGLLQSFDSKLEVFSAGTKPAEKVNPMAVKVMTEIGIDLASWSPSNRSPLIRVPAARGSGTRLEFRSPDSAANPYLALAVSLAAGLDGIKRKLTPGKGSMKNQYEMAEGEKQEAGINTLPRDMKEALEIFKQSTYMKELLGEHIFNKYVEAKSAEWESYQKFVSQWEVDRYLYKI